MGLTEFWDFVNQTEIDMWSVSCMIVYYPI